MIYSGHEYKPDSDRVEYGRADVTGKPSTRAADSPSGRGSPENHSAIGRGSFVVGGGSAGGTGSQSRSQMGPTVCKQTLARTCRQGWTRAGARFFPPVLATHLVKLACELPDRAGRSLSLWTCAELARTAVERGILESISPQSVQRILQSYKLKPWRVHHWLSPKVQMDEAFPDTVLDVLDLYTRPLQAHAQGWSVDEKTSLPPRKRCAGQPARPTRRG